MVHSALEEDDDRAAPPSGVTERSTRLGSSDAAAQVICAGGTICVAVIRRVRGKAAMKEEDDEATVRCAVGAVADASEMEGMKAVERYMACGKEMGCG